jgi:hypothetical protein
VSLSFFTDLAGQIEQGSSAAKTQTKETLKGWSRWLSKASVSKRCP